MDIRSGTQEAGQEAAGAPAAGDGGSAAASAVPAQESAGRAAAPRTPRPEAPRPETARPAAPGPWQRLHHGAWVVLQFVAAATRRFLSDNGLQVAAALTYTSLLSLVPVLALSLAIIAIFPAFEPLRNELREMFTANFLPGSVAAIDEYLQTFTRNAGQLTAAGLIGLVVTSVLLFLTIEDAFNRIWRVRQNRSLVVRLMAFWTLMSLGPILFGFSVSISAEVASAFDSVSGMTRGLQQLAASGPPVLAFLGFFALYWMLPNYPVRWQHAAAGAALAAVLFEVLKLGFGIYIQAYPTYQMIYGALSMIPILLIWTYLAWCVAIAGAVVAALLPNFLALRGVPEEEARIRRRLEIGVLLLDELRLCARTGQPLRLRPLMRRARVAPETLDEAISQMAAARIVMRKGRQQLVLCRDLRHLTLYDLVAALQLLPGLAWDQMPAAGGPPWARELQARMQAARDGAREALSVDLDTFLSQNRAEETAAAAHRAGLLFP